MKFTKSIILAALLGAITQQDLVSGVNLNHRHHHKHSHHHHHPKNIGVRFVQSKDEGTAASVADPTIVEEAAPETEAQKVAEDIAETKVKEAKAKIEATESAKEAEGLAPKVPVLAVEEAAAITVPTNLEEYKELKAEITSEAKNLGQEPAALTEEEQAAKEKQAVDNLTDKADAGRHAKKAALDQAEINNLEQEKTMAAKLAKDPNNPQTQQDMEEIKAAGVKNEKQVLKLKQDLAKQTEAIIVDQQKAQVRENDAKEEDDAVKKAEEQLAVKQEKLKVFEDEKKAADRKVTEQFASQLPEYVAPKANLPEGEKLAKAEAAIAKLDAEAEKIEAEKAAEIEANKQEVGPNRADQIIAEKMKEFDEQEAAAKAAASPVAPAIQAKVAEKVQAKKDEATEKAVLGPLDHEGWTAAMPSYVVNAVPFKPKSKKTPNFLTAEAMAESIGVNISAFGS